MLKFQGININISKPLLGRISFSSVRKKERSNTIYVNPKRSRNKLKEYVAILTSTRNINKLRDIHIPIIHNADGIDSLYDGDIVELLPDGSINVLYQIKSNDNVIFVTSRCNINCIMCPQPADYSEGNLLDMNLKLISLVDKSTEELALTGGEPTIVGDDLLRLILACKHFLPDTSLLLLTNGIAFSDYNYTHLFSSLRHPKITIGVSLYADNSIEHDFIVRSKDAFNEAVTGILNLASFGNQIEIRTVICSYTYKKLLRIAEFIYRNMTFVKHVAFMGLECIGRAKDNFKLLWVEPKEIVLPLGESIHYLIQRRMTVSIYNIPLCLLPENLWPYARQSISDWKVSYSSKCLVCKMRGRCSGLFSSGIEIYEKYLRPIEASAPE